MEIVKNLCPEWKYYIKAPYHMIPAYVVVHNTANDASAINEVMYMISNNDYTSYHYAVDDIEVVQGIPENRTAWHAGDGIGAGNSYGIGVEICYSLSGGERFEKAEDNAAELIADILKRYDWDISHVRKHQDFANKYCPHRTLDMGWERFLNKVREKMEGLTVAQYDELNERLKKIENKMIYNYIDKNMPDWAKPTIQKMVDKKLLFGNEKGELGLTEEMLKIFVANDRAGLYD